MHTGVVLPNADGSRRIKKNNDAFVDDTDGVASKKKRTHVESAAATVAHLQLGAQLWFILICGTGGLVAFHKSFWMMAQHEDTCPPRLKRTPDGEIKLKDDHEAISTIKKLRSDEPNTGLGRR